MIVQLWNRGQAAHDLRIRKLGARGQMIGPVLGGVRITLSGRVSQATWHLKAGRYELELGKDKALRAKARRLDGTPVVVAGTLEVRKGIEVRQRKIITVTSLKGADEK